MADEVDRAQMHEQWWLDAAIQAARGVPSPKAPRSTCSDCGEVLAEHRLYYGICVECQTLAEARAKGWGR